MRSVEPTCKGLGGACMFTGQCRLLCCLSESAELGVHSGWCSSGRKNGLKAFSKEKGSRHVWQMRMVSLYWTHLSKRILMLCVLPPAVHESQAKCGVHVPTGQRAARRW